MPRKTARVRQKRRSWQRAVLDLLESHGKPLAFFALAGLVIVGGFVVIKGLGVFSPQPEPVAAQLVPPSVIVTFPQGGETFTVGQHVNVTWQQTGTIDHFRITLSKDSGGTFPTVVTASASSSPYAWTVNDQPSNRTRIKVEALDAANVVIAGYVPDADFTIQPAPSDTTPPVPGASGALDASNVGLHGLTLGWLKATDDTTPQTGLQYEIRDASDTDIGTVADAEANGIVIGPYATDIGSFDVTGLRSATTYAFNVLVKDATGNKAAYAMKTFSTLADTTAPTPGDIGTIAADGVTTGGFTLHWTKATDDETPAAGLLYEVRQSDSENLGGVAEAEANGTIAKAYTADIDSLALTGLTPDTTYHFTVIVKDAAGNKATYAQFVQKTAADTTAPVPGSAGAIAPSGIGMHGATLTWAKATDDVSPQAALRYEVRQSSAADLDTVAKAEANGAIISASSTSVLPLTVTGLEPAKTYHFNVIVKDEAGNKAVYAMQAVTTLGDTTAPVPGNGGAMTVTDIGTKGLSVRWTRASDDVSATSTLAYELRQSTNDDIGGVAQAEANGVVASAYAPDRNSFAVIGLTPATSYHFNVIVKDEAGNKAAYASVTGTTNAVTTGGGGGGGGGGSSSGGGSPTPLGPAVRLVSPVGGERIPAGSTFNVAWRPQGSEVKNVRISTSIDGGATWTVVNDAVEPFAGRFSWTAPATPVGSMLLKVEELGTGGTILASDVSPASFTVIPSSTPFPVTGAPPTTAAVVNVVVHLGVNATTLDFPDAKLAPKAGDTLTYRIEVRDEGGGPAADVRLTDVLPTKTTYVPASLTIAGAPQTDARDNDAAAFDPSTGSARFELGTLSPGAHSILTLKTRIQTDAASLRNQVILESDGSILQASDQVMSVATLDTIPQPRPTTAPTTPTPQPTVPTVLPVTGTEPQPPAPVPVVTPPAPAPGPAPVPTAPSAPAAPPETAASDVSATPILDALVSATENRPVLGDAIDTLRRVVKAIRENRTVQFANRYVVSPLVLVAAMTATIVGAGAISLAAYGMFLFTQPIALFDRRRAKAYGTVFNRGTRMPIDLAIVRLVDPVTDRPVGSRVTDRFGRYLFLVKPGKYEMEARKPGVYFPPSVVLGGKEGPYADLYRGGEFGSASGIVAKNVPMDVSDQAPDPTVLAHRDARARRVWRTVSIGPLLALGEYAVTPRMPQAVALLAHLVMLLLFVRLARPPRPKSFGVVRDENGKPVKNAVVRVVEAAYDRILESQLTDARGRYAFLVGQNTYFLRFEKPGYETVTTEPIDYSNKTEPSVIDRNWTLKKSAPTPPPPQPQTP